MRSLLIASVILVFGGVTGIASAADSIAPDEATVETEVPVFEPPTPIDPLAHIVGRPDAAKLSLDDLWTEFEIAFANFERDLAATDEANPDTQTGFRNYVQAIDSATSVRDLLGAMLKRTELDEADRLDALDSFLTIEQVSGSLMVEIQECQRGAELLRRLLANPETVERRLLLQGTTQWLAKADRCIERQRLQSQIAAREAQADDAEVARLRQQLADAEIEDARIDRNERAAGEDELVLSRAELLELLRESSGERRGGSLFSSFLTHPRAHLPSHEFGLSVRGGITHVPNFVLGMMYELHGTAEAEAQFGGSFFVRKHARRRDISLNYDYTMLDLGESWWVQKGKSRGSARHIELVTPKHTITVGIDRNFVIGRQERFHIHIGGLFGFSILSESSFDRSRVDSGACLIGISGATSGHLELFEPGGACYEAYDVSRQDPLKIPAILPSLGMRAGVRYVIADRVQLGVEGGLHDAYFYTNASIGVIVGRKFKNQ